MFTAFLRACAAHGFKLAPFIAALVFASALPANAQTTPRLTGDDFAEIMQLYFKYPMVLDNRDAEGYADLFTADGKFNDNVGRAALVNFVRTRPASGLRHAPLTPMVVATPEGASGAVISLFVDVAQTPPTIPRVIQYTDTLVKTPQGWRFKSRVTGPVPPASAGAGAN
jgi:hypothetical protein